MSHYESKITEMRGYGRDVLELGDEIAIVDGDMILVGGDAPSAYELIGATPEIARTLAELGRAVGGDARADYDAYLAECGASEVRWK